jgi:hypothetical protein
MIFIKDPLTLYPRRYSSETPTFYQNDLAMRNTAGLTGGKPIAVWSQSISCVSVVNTLVAFYDNHEWQRCYSFVLSRTLQETIINDVLNNYKSVFLFSNIYKYYIVNSNTIHNWDGCVLITYHICCISHAWVMLHHHHQPINSSLWLTHKEKGQTHHAGPVRIGRWICNFKNIIIISLSMSPLLGYRPTLWITHKVNGSQPTTRAQCGLVRANDCKCSQDQRLNVPSEVRRSSR